jgi:hypothetical protein
MQARQPQPRRFDKRLAVSLHQLVFATHRQFNRPRPCANLATTLWPTVEFACVRRRHTLAGGAGESRVGLLAQRCVRAAEYQLTLDVVKRRS